MDIETVDTSLQDVNVEELRNSETYDEDLDNCLVVVSMEVNFEEESTFLDLLNWFESYSPLDLDSFNELEREVLLPDLKEIFEDPHKTYLCDKNGNLVEDGDVWDYLDKFFRTTYYDNGLPLTGLNYPEDNPTEENDYFEHYDRDQDYWSFFLDFDVLGIRRNNKTGENVVMLDLTPQQLRKLIKRDYEGSEWSHDFE